RLVVGHVAHEFRDVGAKKLDQLFIRDALVFDAVVQESRYDQVAVAAARRFGEQERDLGEMVDVRLLRLALAALAHVLLRSVIERARDLYDIDAHTLIRSRSLRAYASVADHFAEPRA